MVKTSFQRGVTESDFLVISNLIFMQLINNLKFDSIKAKLDLSMTEETSNQSQ